MNTIKSDIKDKRDNKTTIMRQNRKSTKKDKIEAKKLGKIRIIKTSLLNELTNKRLIRENNTSSKEINNTLGQDGKNIINQDGSTNRDIKSDKDTNYKDKEINCDDKSAKPNCDDKSAKLNCDDKNKITKNILITSALPYVNAPIHLGNIIGSMLSADVYNRFCLLRGYNTLFICGSDEYGCASEIAALKEGITPQALCERNYAVQKNICDWFGIKFDYFGRSSNAQQCKIMQDIYLALEKNGYISEEKEEHLYCNTCSRFLADRFVEGTCPNKICGARDARGDQCDKCQQLIDPLELICPRCSICSGVPVMKATEHLYFDLPAIAPVLERWFEEVSINGKWSLNAIAVTRSWFRTGLKKRSVTRDLKWGTPVPRRGYEDRVIYSWLDALVSYISITANYFNSVVNVNNNNTNVNVKLETNYSSILSESSSIVTKSSSINESCTDLSKPRREESKTNKLDISNYWKQWWQISADEDVMNNSSNNLGGNNSTSDINCPSNSKSDINMLNYFIASEVKPENKHNTRNKKSNIELHQFMGKDNIPFHSIILPSLLLATGQPWNLVHRLSVTEYLQYQGGKFSKSKGIGVFGDDAKNSGIPADVWRYYLLANRPENSDSNFDWSEFAAKNNCDLLGNLGNLVMRILKFCVANFNGTVKCFLQEDTKTNCFDDNDFSLQKDVYKTSSASISSPLEEHKSLAIIYSSTTSSSTINSSLILSPLDKHKSLTSTSSSPSTSDSINLISSDSIKHKHMNKENIGTNIDDKDIEINIDDKEKRIETNIDDKEKRIETNISDDKDKKDIIKNIDDNKDQGIKNIHDKTNRFISIVLSKINLYVNLLEDSQIKSALSCALSISTIANNYFQDLEPWTMLGNTENKVYAAQITSILINIIYLLAHLLHPFTPCVTEAICIQLDLPFIPQFLEHSRLVGLNLFTLVPNGHRIGTPIPIFQRIEQEEIEEFAKRFGSKE